MLKEDFRVTRTRDSIKSAFLEILNCKPLRDITVKEITEKARCNRNTFYLHYIDKYDLLEKLCAANIGALEHSLHETMQRPYASSMDWYADIARRCLDAIEADMPFYEIVLGRNAHPLFAGQFREALAGFINATLEYTGKSPQRLEVEFAANGMVGVVRYWLNHRRDLTKENVLEKLNDLVVRLGIVMFDK